MTGMLGKLLTVGAALLTAAAPNEVRADSESIHRYAVTVADDLRSVDVTARLAPRDPPARSTLTARNGETAELTGLATCAGEALSGVAISDTRLRLGRGQRCIRYTSPLRNDTRRGNMPTLAGSVVVSSPSTWLWLPNLGDDERVQVDLVLPDGMTASVPWDQTGPGQYAFSRSPETSRGNALFGAFRQAVVDLPGAELRTALIDSADTRLDRDKTLAWLETAALDVASVSGRFPNPSPQIIVLPVNAERDWWGDPSGSPVPFGHVIRDQGEAVRYFVSAAHSLEAYHGDWTATHEFSHLLLPYVREKWVAEGFASYYQNVLLARRGAYSEHEVWRRLTRSFAKADATRNPPTLNGTRDRSFWEVRMLVYWSGAAVALLADVELRQRSGGRESLDTALAALQDCCLPASRSWSGRELFATLDEFVSTPVFVALYDRYADSRGMPDLSASYRALGISGQGERVRLDDAAPLAHVRQAIMRGPGAGTLSTTAGGGR